MADKKILIIDEERFSRICSAILESQGFATKLFTDIESLAQGLSSNEFSLVLISYPHGAFLLKELRTWDIPTLVLTDMLDAELMSFLKEFSNSYCMIKPIDYEKFRCLVHDLMTDTCVMERGFNVV
ncbi:MAG TPA: hypothetical protein DDX85_12050 [Nitrospiraceae bacterium]|nr:hypothetical protein [Nitrospiraceae bacterium]